MKRADDRGAGSVLVLIAIAVVSAVAAAVLVVSGGIDSRRQVQGAADLSAIAAASHGFEGPLRACAHAATVARQNGAALRFCHVVDGVAEVEVSIRSNVSRVVGDLVGRARAGPADAGFS